MLALAACTAPPAPAPAPVSQPRVQSDAAGALDRLERRLQADTAGSGVEIARRGGGLDLRMPSGVAFDFNASTVRAPFRSVLDRIAATLAGERSLRLDIGGYTDAVGTDAVNLRLSQDRADAVADYLAERGVARPRMAARGFGKANPVASNADADGRARNRRVEIHVVPYGR